VTSDSFDQPLTAPTRTDRVPLGIAFMLGATVMFALSSALSKAQVEDFSFAEVLFFRSFASLVTCAIIILPRTGLLAFRTARLRDHLGRSVTQTVAQSCIVIAFGLMPLAGVLLVAAPGADSFRIGALFALANAVLYGSVTAAVRGMTKTESAETLTMYQMVFLTAFFALALPFFDFVWPSTWDLGMLLLNGVLNAVGQYWWTRALTMAPPATVGPFYYFSLVWAMLLGFMVWGDIPTLGLLAGSSVVVGSGLFLLWHESAKKPVRNSKMKARE